MTEKHLEVLHDHYKETFSQIREREKLRDQLLLALIGLFELRGDLRLPERCGC